MKCKSDHIMLLLKAIQWLILAFKLRAKANIYDLRAPLTFGNLHEDLN